MQRHEVNSLVPMWSGSRHWKITTAENGELQVNPDDHAFVILILFVTAALFVVCTCFVLDVSWTEKMVWSSLIVAGFSSLILILSAVNSRQLQIGPYLTIKDGQITLRNDTHVNLSDFDSFQVTGEWEPSCDSQMFYLMAVQKTGSQAEVLRSVYRNEIVKLKGILDKHLDGLRHRSPS